MKIFSHYKGLTEEYLCTYLDQKEKEFSFVNSWGADVMQRLQSFTLPGKMIRGGLVILAADMLTSPHYHDSIALAAGMELAQSSLLIHDDIMDRDLTRRGAPSFFAQYKILAEEQTLNEPYHFGEAMGICAGDIGFFLLYDIVGALKVDPLIKVSLLQILSRELTLVGLAQMQDVYFGATSSPAPLEDILSLYRHKTARYTFSLPLLLGATLAGAQSELLDKLSLLGEDMGIIFQLRDDELDIFGDEEKIGKPVGSDIRENKKTFYHAFLLKNAEGPDRKKAAAIFGNPDASPEDIKFIHQLIFRYGVQETIQNKINSHRENALSILNSLKIPDSFRETLEELLLYLEKREK